MHRGAATQKSETSSGTFGGLLSWSFARKFSKFGTSSWSRFGVQSRRSSCWEWNSRVDHRQMCPLKAIYLITQVCTSLYLSRYCRLSTDLATWRPVFETYLFPFSYRVAIISPIASSSSQIPCFRLWRSFSSSRIRWNEKLPLLNSHLDVEIVARAMPKVRWYCRPGLRVKFAK